MIVNIDIQCLVLFYNIYTENGDLSCPWFHLSIVRSYNMVQCDNTILEVSQILLIDIFLVFMDISEQSNLFRIECKLEIVSVKDTCNFLDGNNAFGYQLDFGVLLDVGQKHFDELMSVIFNLSVSNYVWPLY